MCVAELNYEGIQLKNDCIFYKFSEEGIFDIQSCLEKQRIALGIKAFKVCCLKYPFNKFPWEIY